MLAATTTTNVAKEVIPAFHFTPGEVLDTPMEREIRRQNLTKAMILGNTYKKKVSITFQTLEGLQRVTTTIWAATEENIILKGGVYIPVACIREVDLYGPE